MASIPRTPIIAHACRVIVEPQALVLLSIEKVVSMISTMFSGGEFPEPTSDVAVSGALL